MPMLPITLEDISNAVHEGFKAALNASDEIIQNTRFAPFGDPNALDGGYLLRKERDVTSKVVEQLSRRLEYVRDPEVDTMYWTVRNEEVVYWDTLWSELDNPPANIEKWNTGAVEPTRDRIALWADLLGINGVRD